MERIRAPRPDTTERQAAPAEDVDVGRVFLGPIETAGYFAHLRAGLDALGVRSTFVDLNQHRFRYGRDDQFLWSRCLIRAMRGRWQTSRYRLFERAFWVALEQVARFSLFVTMLLRHDVFVFSGQTFYPSLRDLAVLKWFGKRVVFVFLGSDSRPPYLNGKYADRVDGRRIAALTKRTKVRLQVVERYADAIVASPLSSHLHERPFVSFYEVGFPTAAAPASEEGARHSVPATDGRHPVPATEGHHPATEERHPAPVSDAKAHRTVVLHAPSHAAGKGTAGIRAIVARLKARGYAIEYRELVGRPNGEVHRELAVCDFVVDQLYSDAPMAGFAREAALHGKPAVVGTYAAEEFDRACAEGKMPPCEWAQPEEVEASIERLATSPAFRKSLGSRARHFVTSEWSCEIVARRLLGLVSGPVPVELCDPGATRYVGGYGMSAQRRAHVIREVVREGGESALMVDDKPRLKRDLLRACVRPPDGKPRARAPEASDETCAHYLEASDETGHADRNPATAAA